MASHMTPWSSAKPLRPNCNLHESCLKQLSCKFDLEVVAQMESDQVARCAKKWYLLEHEALTAAAEEMRKPPGGSGLLLPSAKTKRQH